MPHRGEVITNEKGLRYLVISVGKRDVRLKPLFNGGKSFSVRKGTLELYRRKFSRR